MAAPTPFALAKAAEYLNYAQAPLGPVAQRALEDLARLLDAAEDERYKAGVKAAFQIIVRFMEYNPDMPPGEIIAALKSRL